MEVSSVAKSCDGVGERNGQSAEVVYQLGIAALAVLERESEVIEFPFAGKIDTRVYARG